MRVSRITLPFLLFALVLLPAVKAQSATPVAMVPIIHLPLATGIATHGSGLVVAANFPTGMPNNLDAIAPDGSATPFSALSGAISRPSLVECPKNLPAFDPGSIYFGGPMNWQTSNPGQVLKISADGSTVTVFASLPGEMVRSIAFDSSGDHNWGGRLIAVCYLGDVYSIAADGTPTLLVALGGGSGLPVTGCTVLANSPALGPWSGAILTSEPYSGSVDAITFNSSSNTPNHIQVTRWQTGLARPNCICPVVKSANCYVVDYGYQAGYGFGKSTLYGIAASDMGSFQGCLLAADDGDGSLNVLKWNGASFDRTVIAGGGMTTYFADIVFTKNAIAASPAP